MKSVGIKVWVLTGDKVETAINIGLSCGLLDFYMDQHIIVSVEREQILKDLKNVKKEIDSGKEICK